MTRLRIFLSRLWSILGSRQMDRDIDEEIASHLAEAKDEYIRQGLSSEDAHHAALRSFGGVLQAKEVYRQIRSFAWLDDFRQDFRYTIRALVKSPGFTVVVVLTLALGIGANTAIFSILNGLLLRTLPVHEPERLVNVTDSVLNDAGETRVRAWGYPAWEQIRQRSHLFESATAWSFVRFNLASGGETQFVEGMWADGGFFEMLHVHAMLGRTFSPADDQRGGGPDGPVTVISFPYWQRQFGGAADVIGRAINLNGVPFTIIGVTPPGFFGLEVGRSFDLAVPLRTEALIRGRDSVLDSASTNFLTILARLKRGQSIETAAAELRGVQPEIREATLGPWSKDVSDRYLTSPFTVVHAATGYSNLRSSYERPVLILAVAVALVLLIGCVNVANLLLARAHGRHRELGVRIALGASRLRLARQLFAESLTLSMAGAALGVGIAAYSSRFLVQQLSTPANQVFLDVSIDAPVLAFTIAVTAVTALLFGTAPAFLTTRIVPMDAIREQGRNSMDSGSGVAMEWLVVVQVALSVVLIVAAGVFIRSFMSLASRTLGLEPSQVLVVTLDPQRANIDPAQRLRLYQRALEAVRGLPNVAHAAISHLTPVGGGGFTPSVEISGVPGSGTPAASQRVPADGDVSGNLVSPDWFRTFGTALVAGRDFAQSDGPGSPRVIIVNETFVRRFLGGGGPLGRTITVYPNTPRALSAQVVGVASDAIYSSPRQPAPPTWYLPIAQFDVAGFPFATARLSLRARTASPALLTKSVAAALADVNPVMSLTFRPLADQMRASLTRERIMAQLAGTLGGLALLLAALGLYGVASYGISRRRREIAIRMALGAARRAVVATVLARVSLLVGAGVLAGTGISFWAAKFVDSLVYGLPPREPTTLMGAAILLCVIGGLAVWLPVRKATHMDPLEVLRQS
jgi:putative ABC transport system permease protein